MPKSLLAGDERVDKYIMPEGGGWEREGEENDG